MRLEQFSDDDEPVDAADEVATAASPHDVAGDGSVLKVRLQPGAGGRPESGDEATVHYEGRLLSDGSLFDSSVQRGQPFTFTIGEGVIQGWSEAVPTLKVGEKARFTILAAKGYGANGSAPHIPPQADLVFDISLLSFAGKDHTEDLLGDGTLLKRVTARSRAAVGAAQAAGRRVEKPAADGTCEVRVHLTLRQRAAGGGARVSTTRGPGAGGPLTWRLGAPIGAATSLPQRVQSLGLHPNLDTLVCSMHRGERCHALLRRGEEELRADAELVGWVQDVDLSADADSSVVKRITREAEGGWEKAEDRAEVALAFELYVTGRGGGSRHGAGAGAGAGAASGGSSAEAVHCATPQAPLQFVVDEGQVPEGLELLVKSMRYDPCPDHGEVCDADISAGRAWGDAGSTTLGVPPGVDVQLRGVRVVNLRRPRPAHDHTIEERFETCGVLRVAGNSWFKRKEHARAARRYTAALELVDKDYEFKADADKVQARQAQIPLLLNRAQCALLAGDAAAALVDARAAIELRPAQAAERAKAHFRAGAALLALQNYESADTAFAEVLRLDPDNGPAKKKRRHISAAQKTQAAKDRKTFKNMFKLGLYADEDASGGQGGDAPRKDGEKK